MLNKKFFKLSMAFSLLATTTFGAGASDCSNGACFVTLDNLKQSRNFTKEKKTPIAFLENNILENNIIDKAIPIILENQLIWIFPHSSYVSSEIAEKEAEALILTEIVEKVEDKFLKNTNLPNSEYFCEKDKEVIYLNNDIYECV